MQKILTHNEKQIREFADKLAILYELFNWTWRDDGVPNSKQIEEEIYRLIKDTKERAEMDNDYSCVSTGGLTVEIDCEDLNIKWSKEKSLYLQLTNELI